ncbi:DHS-like NAD/FAD-binding domain-containing protein [Dichomitus squalens LYAD-421 SS1]|nr:DHS-like NAD/FAD-binding domain-containing protein [Dichomitus squalens LYAD-421 SS1]EJF64612.1 DHS-like NAD/FAD-binding domain-containing protein [Dichomitus squalens LYAD-421 SS1]
MTAFLPLDAGAPLPPSPAFLVPSPEPAGHVKRVIKAVLKARRIAVVCGAGISVQAGIPDFRSSEGLFQSLKKDHPMLSSGKDLFDASVFNSEDTTSLFCQMIAQLSQLSDAAQPTAFHRFLRVLNDRRRLLRVYTQNIDALEEKSGLTFGVPELDVKRAKPRSSKGKAPALDSAETVSADLPQPDEPSTSRLPSPPVETPKCIPLHGTLQLMHCVTCTHSYPLRDYIDSLVSGTPPPCPQCTALEETRQLVGKRSRGVGKLRPSVVLYNEDHKDGEEVGNVVRKDLMGSSKGKGRAGADLLLVVGTSLRVPGTKRIVREFSKAVRSRHAAMNAPPDPPADGQTTSAHGLVTPTPSPRRSPAEDEEPPVRTIYLNLDFPVPTREWEGVFDVWIRGDAQTFARMVHEELEKEEQAKEAAKERKRKREEAAAESARLAEEQEEGETEQKKEKGKKALSSRGRKEEEVQSSLPTPPTSRDDPTRLTIKLPPLHKRLVPEVVISTLPKVTRPVHIPGPFSSPLSSPPVSTCDSPPSSPPRPNQLPTPPRPTRTISGTTELSSPTSSMSSSPSPSPSKKRKTSRVWPLSVHHCTCILTTMSTSAASTSQPIQSTSAAVEHTKDDDVPHLGVLEEDDEFEEFAVADWDDSHTDLAHLGGTAPGAAKSGGDKLWEDNWDDDDIEDDFSVQLRNELAKKKGNGGGPEPMQH